MKRVKACVSILALAGCTAATVPTGPLGPGELRLLKLDVPATIRAGVPYIVTMPFETAGSPQILRACFFWSGWDGGLSREGPYCFPVKELVAGPPGGLTVQLRTNNPRRYTLEGYAEYQRGAKAEKTNEVSAVIDVVP